MPNTAIRRLYSYWGYSSYKSYILINTGVSGIFSVPNSYYIVLHFALVGQKYYRFYFRSTSDSFLSPFVFGLVVLVVPVSRLTLCPVFSRRPYWGRSGMPSGFVGVPYQN